MTDYKLEQQHVAEVKYTGYASGNELVWTRGAGLQFLPAGTKLYAASIHAPTPAAYLDVGAGGYMYLGTDLTEDQVGSLPWGRHILAIVGTYGADGYVPAERPFDYTEAYYGARQDSAVWKRRALEAELRVRDQDQIIDRMGDDLNAINGPTFMGEPLLPKQPAEQDIQKAINYAPEALRELGMYLGRLLDEDRWPEAERKLEAAALAVQPDQSICDFYEATDYPSLVRELVGHVKQLQEAAMRNVKPWEDTFPPTLLPSYIKRIEGADAEQQPVYQRCEYCDGTGDVHSIDGEWRGACDCQQPAPDVEALVEALEGVLDGRPLDTEFWDRCEQFIAAHRKGGIS